MRLIKELRAAGRLMRPDQWTILTLHFLVPLMMMAPGAQGGGCWLNPAGAAALLTGWLCWVVLLNGGTLAFNSAFDRDSGPVAYLPDPPQPPPWLAGAALGLMGLGVLLAFLVVGQAMALLVGSCVVLSVLYSAPPARLKARPGLDLLVNILGYGAGSTLAGFLTARAAYFGSPGVCAAGGWKTVAWPGLQGPLGEQFTGVLAGGGSGVVVGFGLLFGSLYPLTQLYQMNADRERGDRTLVTALGPRLSLLLAVALAVGAAGAFLQGLVARGAGWELWLPLLALGMWIVHLGRWLHREPERDDAYREKGMYRALNLWAVVDGAVLAAWYLAGRGGS
ncbi:hypothetical protein CSB20_00725 [bacterium DOLZORAL124_64_63]|nr:MAG: hypothetical protein CSB20_00725 [bacterium DOLZORAL124_64_63]